MEEARQHPAVRKPGPYFMRVIIGCALFFSAMALIQLNWVGVVFWGVVAFLISWLWVRPSKVKKTADGNPADGER